MLDKWKVFSAQMLNIHVLNLKQLYLWKCRAHL